jgi:nucleotide-binding universal stress UspA family protein
VIVVATDGSASADAAARLAIELARAQDEELLFVTVWQELKGDFGLPYLEILAPDVRDIEREWATRVADEAAAHARETGASASAAIRHGNAAEQICALITEESASMIVLGSHGWGTFTGTLLGSTLSGVLQKAPCPVLVSPPPPLPPTAGP